MALRLSGSSSQIISVICENPLFLSEKYGAMNGFMLMDSKFLLASREVSHIQSDVLFAS